MPTLVMFGLLCLVGLIVAIAKAFSTASRVDSLEERMYGYRSLADRVEALEAKLEKPTAKPTARSPRAPEPSLSLIPPAQTESPAPLIQSTPAPSPPLTPSRTREEWEAFVGGKLLNRIGAFALIIGLGFFLKYAFDNNWISETVRVLIGVLVGFACLLGARWTHKRGFQIFAQGLVGAGIAILYLSVYASFNFYQLVPQWLAFVLMSVVTVIAVGQGFFYDSLATALLGCAGGLLTPLMLSTGTANEVGLFTYLALLDVALLASVIQKPSWHSIEPIALAATWLYYVSWYDASYSPDALGTTIFFIGVFWLLFFAADVTRLAAMRLSSTPPQHPAGVVGVFAAFLSLYFLIDNSHHAWMGTTTLILAAPYAGAVFALRRRSAPDRYAESRMAITALALLVTAAAIEFAGFTTIRWWALEAMVLMLLGVTRRSAATWRIVPIILLLAVLKFLGTDGALETHPATAFTFVWNARCATLALLALASAACAVILRGAPSENGAAVRRWLIPTLDVAAAVMVFALVTVELNDRFLQLANDQTQSVESWMFFLRILTVGVAWQVLAVGIGEVGGRVRGEQLTATAIMIAGMGMMFVVLRGIAFDPIGRFVPAWNARVGLMLASIAFAVSLVRRLRGPSRLWPWCARILPVLGIGIVALALSLLTGETLDYFNALLATPGLTHEAVERLTNLQQLSLSGIWLASSLALMAFGIWRGWRMQRIVAFVLFGFTIAKIFIYDLSFLQTLYRIVSFIGLGVILLAVSYAYQRYKHLMLGPSQGGHA